LRGDPRSGIGMFIGFAGSAQSLDDGRFVIGGVPAGSYRVSASIMMIGGGTGPSSIGGGSSGVAWSSGVSGGVSGGFVNARSFGPGGSIDRPSEVVVADADVENVRVVTRRPNPQ